MMKRVLVSTLSATIIMVLTLHPLATLAEESSLTAIFSTIETTAVTENTTLKTKIQTIETTADTEASTASSTSVPVSDSAINTRLKAITVGTTKAAVNTTKEQAKSKKDWAIYLAKTVLQGIAVALLNKLTQATVNWIDSGFKGNPQFVENPEQFFKEAGETYLKNVVDTIGYGESKYPYGRAVAKALIKNYLYEKGTIEDKLKFTFDSVVGNDWKNFEADFRFGGWDAYNYYMNEPANNSFNFMFKAFEETHKAMLKAQQDIDKELDRGRGFLNQKVCVAERSGPDPSLTGGTDSGSGGQNVTDGNGQYGTTYSSNGTEPGTGTGDCLRYKTASPGAVVEQQLNQALGSRFTRSALGEALGNSISNIINSLSNLLVSKGLSALGDAINGNGSGVSANSNGISWAYSGLSLSGPQSDLSTDTTTPTSIWDVPDQSVDLYELLVTGPVTATTQVTNADGTITFVPSAYGDTLVKIAQDELAAYNAAHTLALTLPAKLLALDQCLPGPGKNWELRLAARFNQVQTQLSQLISSSGAPNAYGQFMVSYLSTVQQGVASNISLRINTYTIPGEAGMINQFTQTNDLEDKVLTYEEKIADLTGILNQLTSLRDQVQAIGPANTMTAAGTSSLVNIINQFAAIQPELPSQASRAIAESERDKIQATITVIDKYLNTNEPMSCPAQKNVAANQYNFNYVVTPKGSRIGSTVTGIPTASQQASLASGTGIPNLVSGETVQVNQAFDQSTSYHVVRQPSVSDIALSSQSQTQMINDLTNSPYSAGAANLSRLNQLSQSDLNVVYSAITGNATHQYFSGISNGPGLVTLALDWFEVEQSATPITVDQTTEQMFYCQNVLDTRDVRDLLRSWNVNISCSDFYDSSVDDYL